MIDFTQTICLHELHSERRSRPMRGRFAFRVKTTQLQATSHGTGSHTTIIKATFGAIDSQICSLNQHLPEPCTIQIAIAGSTG